MRRIWLVGFIVFLLVFYGCEKPGEEEKEIPTDATSWEVVHNAQSIMPTLYTGELISGDDFIILGGDKGFIAISDDGGYTWETDSVGSMADSGYSIRSIAFADEQVGVLGGDMCLYRTGDGGQSWSLMLSQEQIGETRIKKVDYLGDGIFCAIAGNYFIKSTDYGETWNIIPITYLDETSYGLMSFQFIDQNNGFAVSSGPIGFITTDGGETWEPETMDVGFNVYDITSTDEGTYFICGDTSSISYRTGEGEWTMVASGIHSDTASLYVLSDIEINGNLGIVVGNDGMVSISTDAGESWQVTNALNIYGDIECVTFDSDGNYTLVVGNDLTRADGVARLGTGLSSWKGISYGSVIPFYDLEFLDTYNGILVGKQTAIFKTYDAGANMFQKPIDTDRNITISGVDFCDENNGIAVGSDGIILFSVDGGESWNILDEENIDYPEEIDHLNKVQYIDEYTVYAIGLDEEGNSIFLKSEDGGNSWAGSDIGVNADILDLHFLDAELGWIVGDGGTIVKTTDGGNSWEQLNSGTNSALTGVYFHNPDYGWICGTYTIMKTTDGGNSWDIAPVEGIIFAQFRDIVFRDSESGWIVGNFGYILHTVDGGETWYRQMAGITENNLLAIDMLDYSNIWICGERGMLLKLIP